MAMYRALRHLFDCLVTVGNLRIVDAHDRIFVFGDGHGAPVTVSLSDKKLEYELALDPAISFGEAYMDGRLWMESGTIYDLFEIMFVHSEPDPACRWGSRLPTGCAS